MITQQFQDVCRLLAGSAMALAASMAGAQSLPQLNFVIVDNLGHLPMIVGAERGIFREHGVDVKLSIVKSGTEIVNALNTKQMQGGNMSATTFIKGRQGGQQVSVFALAMNDATRANADDPLAIIARKDSGIRANDVKSLRGKRIGVWKDQTPDEYLKIVLDRNGIKESEVEIVNIPSNPALVPNFADAKVDAVVSLEPWNTLILSKVPGAFEVVRGGGYMSYMMVSTFQDDSMIRGNPDLVMRFARGLAASSQYIRQNRDAAVDIFSKVVPGVDVDITRRAVRHISYDPRISAENLKAFESTQDELIRLGSSTADKRLALSSVVLTNTMREVERRHPELFRDLKPVTY